MTLRMIPLLTFLLTVTVTLSAATGCTGADPLQCFAVAENTVAGTRTGDHTATQDAGGAVEVLVEQDAAIGPPPKRADLLEHRWQFDVAAGGSYRFFVRASRLDAGGDGDNFSFAFSRDGGQSWTAMLTVNSETLSLYSYDFAAGVAGSLLVRAVDTDRTAGRKNHATLNVDHMYVEIASGTPPPPPPPSGPQITGYYTSWSLYAREYYVNEHQPGVDHIPAEKLTRINYAFANLLPDGSVVLGDEFADTGKIFGNEPPGAAYKGNFQQLNILKSQYPHIKTLISVGGWTWSNHFSDVFADQVKRQHFCDSLLNFVMSYGFDGADLDWEYPGDPGEGDNSYRPGIDKDNYVTTLAACRPMFVSAGKMLTIANSCNPRLYEEEMNLAGMVPYLDGINLMAYDLHGPWDSRTGHHSQLALNPGDSGEPRFTLSACAEGHIAAGVPPSLISAGVPAYGRSYAKVTNAAGGNPAILGLFQAFSGVPAGTWDGGQAGTTGVFDYQDIVLNILPKGAYAYDTAAEVPTVTWQISRKQGLGFLSYDDTKSVCGKAAYARGKGLGGLMLWELSGDIENHPGSLVNAMYCGLNPAAEGCATVCGQ
ncbi:MAG: hypothetical protein IT158_03075 [Bryobacterales bacterium]|nr:hypothetical protein [Bryobacterales bacterium]